MYNQVSKPAQFGAQWPSNGSPAYKRVYNMKIPNDTWYLSCNISATTGGDGSRIDYLGLYAINGSTVKTISIANPISLSNFDISSYVGYQLAIELGGFAGNKQCYINSLNIKNKK